MTARPVVPSVEVIGEDKAAADLARMGHRAGDVRGVSYKVRTVYRKSEERRFQLGGPGWPPLEESTRARKEQQHLDPRIMRAKGDLFRALTSPRAKGQIDQRMPSEFRFGTTLPYAVYHETGRGVPMRQLIDLTPSERHQVDQAISAFIASGETT